MSDIRLTAGWVAERISGTIVAGDPTREFSGVSIDSRTVSAGELFIAVRGERFDGREFAQRALEAGAAGVVTSRGWSRDLASTKETESAPVVIEVDDTTTALQALAREVRRASGTKVVAITGSAGKTTTKEVASEFLAARYRVVRNRGNLNNHIGLPLSLMELRHRPEIAVVELGMNHAGEIAVLVGVAEPDVRVWTNVGEAHLGFFASLDAIADAKAEIFERAQPSTLLVANADDERIAARLSQFRGRIRTFGVQQQADVRATMIRDRGIAGVAARVSTPKGEFDLETPLAGRGNLANVLAATAVAIEFDVPLEAIARRAKSLRAASHRGEVVELKSGATVIDDSYNANPAAVKCALDVLRDSRAAGRRVAVLGEMLELGARAVDLHEEIGRAAARAGVELLIAVGGPPAAALAKAAVDAGMARDRVRHVPTSDEAGDLAAATARAGDLILVKGSRGVGTDRVVERLKAERG